MQILRRMTMEGCVEAASLVQWMCARMVDAYLGRVVEIAVVLVGPVLRRWCCGGYGLVACRSVLVRQFGRIGAEAAWCCRSWACREVVPPNPEFIDTRMIENLQIPKLNIEE
ncbi:hypothetical protein Dimus_000628 [Dionaea muscipula]